MRAGDYDYAPGKEQSSIVASSGGGTIGRHHLDFSIAFFYSLLSTSTQRLLLAFSFRTISPVLVGIYFRLGGFLLIPSNLSGLRLHRRCYGGISRRGSEGL